MVQLSEADANGRAIYALITKTNNGEGMSVNLPPGSAFRGFIDCDTLFALIPRGKVKDCVPTDKLHHVVDNIIANFNM